MNGDLGAQDLATFLDNEIYPAIWESLDTAFPAFGWHQSGDVWTAKERQRARKLPGSPDPGDCRAYRHIPFGFFAGETEFVPWTSCLEDGDLLEAVRRLADLAAVPLPAEEFPPEEIKRVEILDHRTRLLETSLLEARMALGRDDGAAGRVFLEDQGFTPAQMEEIEVGFFTSPRELSAVLENHGFSAAEIEASGFMSAWWTGRVVGPWRNRLGRIVNVWGRRLDPHSWIADTESRIQQIGPVWVFQTDGNRDSPFGLDRARSRDLILVNNILDVLALRAAGFDDAITLAGADSSEEQLRALTAARVRGLTLNLDYDPRDDPCEDHGESFCLRCFPGFQTTLQVLDQLTRSRLMVSVVDPCRMADMNDISEPVVPRQFLRANGPDAYKELVSTAQKGLVFRADTILRECDLTTEKGKDAAVQALLQYDGTLQDERDRQAFWGRAAEVTGYSYAFLFSRAQSRAGRRERERLEQEMTLLLEDSRRDLDENRTTPEGLVNSLSEKLESLRTQLHLDQPEPFAVDELVENVKKAGEGKFSGWTALDRIGIRFYPAELAVMGSRTGHGKTTVLISLLLNWLETYPNETFILYSHEIPTEAVMIKLASALTRKFGGKGWTYYGIRSRLRRYEDYAQEGVTDLDKAFDTLRSWEDRLVVVYRPTWTVEDICAHARQIAERTGGIGGILVDYLQLVPSPAGGDSVPNPEVSEVARRLKSLAVDLACPVVAAAQIPRESVEGTRIPVTGRFEERQIQAAIRSRAPQLHHLRESGSEQAADLVLGLLNYRADFLGERQILDAEERGKPGRLELIVLKNRYGGLGSAGLVLEAWTSTIRDREKDDRI